MRERRNDLKRKPGISDKIEVNKDRIYRISDPTQLAEVFYPARNASQRRAAFLAIFFANAGVCVFFATFIPEGLTAKSVGLVTPVGGAVAARREALLPSWFHHVRHRSAFAPNSFLVIRFNAFATLFCTPAFLFSRALMSAEIDSVLPMRPSAAAAALLLSVYGVISQP